MQILLRRCQGRNVYIRLNLLLSTTLSIRIGLKIGVSTDTIRQVKPSHLNTKPIGSYGNVYVASVAWPKVSKFSPTIDRVIVYKHGRVAIAWAGLCHYMLYLSAVNVISGLEVSADRDTWPHPGHHTDESCRMCPKMFTDKLSKTHWQPCIIISQSLKITIVILIIYP